MDICGELWADLVVVQSVAPERIWKWGHTSGAKRRKFFLVVPLHFFGSKSAISRFVKRFRDGQYSLVSFVCAASTHGTSPCTAIFLKVGGMFPRAIWSQHQWVQCVFFVKYRYVVARTHARFSTVCRWLCTSRLDRTRRWPEHRRRRAIDLSSMSVWGRTSFHCAAVRRARRRSDAVLHRPSLRRGH